MAKQFRLLRQKFRQAGIPFRDYFRIILTDNGGEFADVDAIELDSDGNKETRVFFCDPMCSHQKGKVEKNHTLLRDICPKGSNFDYLTQELVDIIFSHINSTARAVFNGKTPYELFIFLYGKEVAHLLGIHKIPAKEVIQTKKLLNMFGVTAF